MSDTAAMIAVLTASGVTIVYCVKWIVTQIWRRGK